jgi:hypothetical protein
MTNAKYAKYVQPLRLRTEVIFPSFRGKISDFSLVHDEKSQPDCPIWIETYHAYAPGTGVFAPSELAPVIDGKPVEEAKNVGQHSHNDFDEIYFFYGTDHTDNTRLGGEIEMWLGHGEDAQKFIMKEPTAVFVPKGLAHNPWIVTKINDPKLPIMITVVALTKKYSLAPEAVKNYPYPPDFSMEKIGVPQPGKGKYTAFVNRITLSQDILISQLFGRVCVPNLMFDDKVFRAPIWAEFFLVYAGGTGVGVPTLGDPARADAMSYWDFTKGMQHYQTYDEVFLYLPTDPHDTLNLGGEAVVYLGEEGHSITKPSAIYVPGKVPHNPQYYKRVERPYYMIVLAITDNAEFHEGEFTPSPAPKTFRF